MKTLEDKFFPYHIHLPLKGLIIIADLYSEIAGSRSARVWCSGDRITLDEDE
jgi:hypothetical protein